MGALYLGVHPRMASISPIILEEEGSRLRAAYQRAKLTRRLTQTDVAAECGWKNASTFNRILSGRIPLTLDSLTKLAQVLKLSPAAISPRLAHESGDLDNMRISRLLSVSLVRSVTRGCWGEPFVTARRILFYSADETAFALTFESGLEPIGFSGWVVVIEPASRAVVGDRVVVRNGAGKYSIGLVAEPDKSGGFAVEIEGRGAVLTTPQRCMLVAAMLPESQLV